MITLVRHGETAWNMEGRWQGQADVLLSDRGRTQARLLAARLVAEGLKADHLYASDLQRAWETALLIAPALRLPVQPLPALREVHVGAWSGLTEAEVQARYGEHFLVDVQRGGKRGDHGESDHEFNTRIVPALRALAEKHAGERLIVVTHGAVIRVAVEQLIASARGQHVFIRNTSLTTLSFDGHGWHLYRLNDDDHLPDADRRGGAGRTV
jgi:broad specificity phosphatase PhoE